nr:MAG TPA: prohead serine protease [Caudoviricetes sp.]
MRYKQVDVQVDTANEGLAEGQFEAYASTFDKEPDAYGDVVAPGAFADTLKEWATAKGALPVLWGHDTRDPFNNVGHVVKAEEDVHGLKVVGQLDLENPTAAQVYRLLKTGRVTKMSFAYDIVDSAVVTRDGKSVHELRKLNIYEVSVVAMPANPTAEVLAVKEVADADGGKVEWTEQDVRSLKKWVAYMEANPLGGEQVDSKREAKPEAGEGLISEAVQRVKQIISDLETGHETEGE